MNTRVLPNGKTILIYFVTLDDPKRYSDEGLCKEYKVVDIVYS